MARKGRGLITCCCIIPLILLVLIIGSIYGAYAFLPLGKTFGFSDQELLPGVTLRDLGLEDKSLRDFLKKPIKDLGSLGDIELADGIKLNNFGLENNSILDIGRKEIKDLGFYDKPFSEMLNSLLPAADSGNSGDTNPLTAALGKLSFKKLKLGSERLLDIRLKNLISIAKTLINGEPTEDIIGSIIPIMGKKIGALGNGEFQDLDLYTVLELDIEELLESTGQLEDMPQDLIDELKDLDLSGILTIKSLKFTDGADVTQMTFIDLVMAFEKLDMEAMLESVMGDLGEKIAEQLLVDEDIIEENVIEEGFGKDEFKQEEELESAKDALKNEDAGTGIPKVKDEHGQDTDEIDYLKIFEQQVVFDNKAQITLKDTELTAIFNDVIAQNADYEELKDLDASIRQVVLLGKDQTSGNYQLKVTFTIVTAALKGADFDLGMAEALLPKTLYFTVIYNIEADVAGVLTYEIVSASLDNLKESLQDYFLGLMNSGSDQSITDYAGELVGDMFVKFMNNLGSTGTYDKDSGIESLGNDGLDTARQISIVTHTDESGGQPTDPDGPAD